MTFVGAFHNGATSLLAGALLSRRAPRQHVHTVHHRASDSRKVDQLIAALRRESERSAALQAQVDSLRMQLAIAGELLAAGDED